MPQILLIDRDATSRPLAARLAAEGCTVALAASEAQALQRCASAPVDVILLNMTLPQGAGLATFQALRAEPTTRDVPTVLLRDDLGEDYWAALPETGDGPTFVGGRRGAADLLVARILQALVRPVVGEPS